MYTYPDGKPYPNVANLGGKLGDIVKLMRGGEYSGIAVELLEDLRPILTDNFVIRILTMLKKEDYITPINILNLASLEQLFYILDQWGRSALEKDPGYFRALATKKFPAFDQWIKSVTHDPLLGKLRVAEIGFNEKTGDSVVPAEWIGREFESGYDMQEHMSELPHRLGKPPVTYAIIYSMWVQRQDGLMESIANTNVKTIFQLDLVNGQLKSEVKTSAPEGKIYSFVVYDTVAVAFKLDDILQPKGKIEGEHTQSKLREVGLLVSRLQKAVRRGRFGSKAMVETVAALNESPNYNLPEHGFLRVSASKQLIWRLFISIMEDCRPYISTSSTVSLLDMILLVLITQKVQEYKFTAAVMKLILETALLAQFNDTPEDMFWLSEKRNLEVAVTTPLNLKSPYHSALSLALDYIPMMGGDRHMLGQYYSVTNPTTLFKPFTNLPTKLPSKTEVYDDIVLSSYDMHVKTNIILYYQACAPIGMTTKQISGYIWDVSSKYNVRRDPPERKTDPLIIELQQYYLDQSVQNKVEEVNQEAKKPAFKLLNLEIENVKPTDLAKRTSFLLIFGQKYRSNSREVVIAGTPEEPFRVKIQNEWTFSADLAYGRMFPTQDIDLRQLDPPFGYKWTQSKVHVKLVDGKPYINDKLVNFFDGGSIIESIKPVVEGVSGDNIKMLCSKVFSGLGIKWTTLLKFREVKLKTLTNWADLSDGDYIDQFNLDIVSQAYTKIFNQFNNNIMIGPVSRTGHRMANSIDYLLEGKLWAVFSLFSYLYPGTFRPNGSLNFVIKKESPGYVHLIESIRSILFRAQKITGPIPKILTKLWDHQRESVNRILAGFQTGRTGFGDASDVGSGKTLTSLQIAADLIKKGDLIYTGILILLPGNKLIKTWSDELEKHTKGFDIKFQEHSNKIGPIQRNTIVVTTMGRMRDHPINHKWLLVVIDECLTVQNKNALWTQEAWRQSMMAKHLVMMSATFFRTRFDKLYYMLKMLNTGLPEQKEYLDAILLETIVSQVSSKKRNWTSNFNYFNLGVKSRAAYDVIHRSDLDIEKKFAKLNSFLVKDLIVVSEVTTQLKALIKKQESLKRKCLIYAQASAEAERWSQALGIPIYPKKGQHCIVTINDGTYGLNDLVIYDTIVMRPPQSDKLPQIKGRLDRPGNEANDLYIEYFVLKDTLEEGLIIRLNIASQFIHKYIMPLAKFYDVSVNFEKYIEEAK
jgi:hypothetical protein